MGGIRAKAPSLSEICPGITPKSEGKSPQAAVIILELGNQKTDKIISVYGGQLMFSINKAMDPMVLCGLPVLPLAFQVVQFHLESGEWGQVYSKVVRTANRICNMKPGHVLNVVSTLTTIKKLESTKPKPQRSFSGERNLILLLPVNKLTILCKS